MDTSRPSGKRDGLLRALVHRLDGLDAVGLQHRAAFLLVGACQADDELVLAPRTAAERFDQSLGHFVAARDAAEDVDEQRFHFGIGGHDVDGFAHDVRLGAAADIEEVRRLAACGFDRIECAHHEPGAVADDAHVAIEMDVRETDLARAFLERVVRQVLFHASSSLWRNNPMSSMSTFASEAMTRPSLVMASGLISSSIAPTSKNSLYSLPRMSTN